MTFDTFIDTIHRPLGTGVCRRTNRLWPGATVPGGTPSPHGSRAKSLLPLSASSHPTASSWTTRQARRWRDRPSLAPPRGTATSGFHLLLHSPRDSHKAREEVRPTNQQPSRQHDTRGPPAARRAEVHSHACDAGPRAHRRRGWPGAWGAAVSPASTAKWSSVLYNVGSS